MTNYFKSISGDHEFTGMNLILGTYCIHLLEAENVILNEMLRTLNEYTAHPNTPY